MKKYLTVGLSLLLVLSFISLQPALAQDSISRIVIANIATDAETFPDIVVNALVLDSENRPVTNLLPEMFELTENDEVVSFEMNQVSAGFNTVLVLDIGNWGAQRVNNGTVASLMKEYALKYIDTMTDEDYLAIVAIYDDRPLVVAEFTSDKANLRESILGLNWKNAQTTYGIEGIRQAQILLEDLPQDSSKNIVFISPGIMTRHQATNEERLGTMLLAKGIPVFSIYIPSTIEIRFAEYFQTISNVTKGAFIKADSISDLNDFFTTIEYYRTQYQFFYRSTSDLDQQRTVVVKQNIQAGVSDSAVYAPDPSWVAPLEIEIIVNNNALILNPESTAIAVPVQINVRNLGNRRIESAMFLVNDRILHELTSLGAGEYSAMWNVTTDDYSIGNNSVTVSISITDEFGTSHPASLPLTIIVEPPADMLCNLLSNLPGVGNSLGSSCTRRGFGMSSLLNVILGIVIVALLILGWYKRDTVKEVVVRETNRVVDRLTNRLRKQTPKARLIAVQGIAKGERSEFDLFGETPIGRSKEFAHLIFENDNISRLHCIIHEAHIGYWTIQDQESANGTFVNGTKLAPFVEKEIDTGDLIELGPVEYGGIKFRFDVIDSVSEESGVLANDEPDTRRAPEEDNRTTKQFKNRTEDVDFDPSDPSNQKW